MESIPTEVLREAKRMGFSDGRLAGVWRLDGKGAQEKVRHLRKKHGIAPVYKRVDTCAAEFESYTPYLYSTYEEEDEAAPTDEEESDHSRQRARTASGRELSSITAAAMRLRAARRWLRDHHDQLQSGDGLDRLRHQRPPLLRAADPGRRVRHLRARSFGRRAGRRDRAVRRTDAAESRAAAEGGGRENHRHVAGVDRPGGRPQALRQTARRTRNSAGPGRDGGLASKKRSRARTESDIRCWCGLRTCWADAPW